MEGLESHAHDSNKSYMLAGGEKKKHLYWAEHGGHMLPQTADTEDNQCNVKTWADAFVLHESATVEDQTN